MKGTDRSLVVAAFVLAGLAVAVVPAAAQKHHLVVTPDQIKWGPVPPVFPAGAEIAVLEGNPAAKGPIVLRLKFPAGYVIAPHWHSMDERVTVLQGTFYIGAGDDVDKAASQAVPAGGLVSLPATMHHYAWVKTPATVQVHLDGPFDIFYIHPSDDPRNKGGAPATK